MPTNEEVLTIDNALVGVFFHSVMVLGFGDHH
jgi:hypothetical protein